VGSNDTYKLPLFLNFQIVGPPGTGKSYLGVVLVRAFIVIRNLWMKSNPSVGTRPILVLSYKNHAIDEFLSDLVASERSVANSRGGLIRIGGHCGDARLQQFSEKSFSKIDPEAVSYRQKAARLHDFKEYLETLSNQSATFLAFKEDMFSENQENEEENTKQRNAAAYEATTILVSSMLRVTKMVKNNQDADIPYDTKIRSL